MGVSQGFPAQLTPKGYVVLPVHTLSSLLVKTEQLVN